MSRKKKLRLSLGHFYQTAKYAGALFAALAFPFLSETTWLMGDVCASRRVLLVWVAALLSLGLWLDKSRAQARAKDQAELAARVRYGGMNESTFLALTAPLMFILDALAIAHIYLSYFKTGGVSPDTGTTLLMAVGMVLFIYGRALPGVRFGSVWGVATTRARQNEAAWKRIHRAASQPVTLLGLGGVLLGMFLGGTAAFAASAAVCAAAFAVMFLLR